MKKVTRLENGVQLLGSELILQRLVAGIGWPTAGKPGFVVLLGEELTHRPPYRYHLLAEAESNLLNELFRACLKLKAEYFVNDFYAAPDKASFDFFYYWQSELHKSRTATFSIFETEVTPYSLHLIRSCLDTNNKSLFLGNESKIPGSLMQITPDAKIEEHPAVAALAAALSFFKENEPITGLPEPEYAPADPFENL